MLYFTLLLIIYPSSEIWSPNRRSRSSAVAGEDTVWHIPTLDIFKYNAVVISLDAYAMGDAVDIDIAGLPTTGRREMKSSN